MGSLRDRSTRGVTSGAGCPPALLSGDRRPVGLEAADADPISVIVRSGANREAAVPDGARWSLDGMAVGSEHRIHHRSLASQTADTLRDMILKGTLRPGHQLRHEEIARDLGVSTMPVREALLRLSHEGFVMAKPGRSFVVNRLTRGDIADVYWLHSLLAGELTARACRHADDDLVTRLEGVLTAWPATVEARRLEKLNWEFHRTINRAAESPKLLSVMRNTLVSIPQEFYALLPDWKSVSQRGHERIVRAFRKRDDETARAAAEGHVRQAGELLIRYFSEQGYWVAPENGA